MRNFLFAIVLATSFANAETKSNLTQYEQKLLTQSYSEIRKAYVELEAKNSRLQWQRDQLSLNWDNACNVIKRAYRDGADLRGVKPADVCRQ